MTELNKLKRFGQKPSSDNNRNEMSYDFESQFRQDSSAFYYNTAKSTAVSEDVSQKDKAANE